MLHRPAFTELEGMWEQEAGPGGISQKLNMTTVKTGSELGVSGEGGL